MFLIPGIVARRKGNPPESGGGSPSGGPWAPRTMTGSGFYTNHDGGDDGTPLAVDTSSDFRIYPQGCLCLDDTYALLAAHDPDNTEHKVWLLSRSGTTLTTEDSITFTGSQSNDSQANLTWISDTKAVLFWTDASGTDEPSMYVITRSGDTISAGTVHELESSSQSSRFSGICMLSDVKGVVAYSYSSSNYVKVFEVSGTIITSGSSLSMSYSQPIGATRLDDDAVAISGFVTTNTIGVEVFSISGTTLTSENNETIYSGDQMYRGKIDFSNLDGTTYQCYAYGHDTSGTQNVRVVGVQIDSASSYDIVAGSDSTNPTNTPHDWYHGQVVSTDEYAFISFSDIVAGQIVLWKIDWNGNTLNASNEVQIAPITNSGGEVWSSIDFFDDDYMLVGYSNRQVDNNYDMYAIVLYDGT